MSSTPRYSAGYWPHSFAGRSATCFVVLDRVDQVLAHAEVQESCCTYYRPANREELADLKESIEGANPEAFDQPVSYSLELFERLRDITYPSEAAPFVNAVRILVGAEASYACITTNTGSLDVRLNPGRGPSAALLEFAEEQRDKAAQLLRRARFAELAAAKL